MDWDISLDSSVEEHLTSNAGVPGSIPIPAINFHSTGISLYIRFASHLVLWPSLFRHLYLIFPDSVNLCLWSVSSRAKTL